MTDGVGQVTFPDVPPGRYVIIASRPGFIERQSAAFTVRGPDTAHVLLDMPLAFVPPAVEVRANAPSPTDSVQPVSMSDMLSGPVFESAPLQGDDFQSLLPLLPGVVRDARRPPAHQGRPADAGRAAGEQRQPDRPVDRRLRRRSSRTERGIGGGAVEPVRGGVRPLLDQHHADPDPARHQRLGYLDRQPDAALARADSGIRGFEPRFSVRGPIKKDRVFLAQDVQFRYVGDTGAEPAGRAGGQPPELRLVHARRRRAVAAARGHRRPDPVPARAAPRDDEHVQADLESPPTCRRAGWRPGSSTGWRCHPGR